ncbi:hypothetical protein [Microvirga makkahensis]|uniref:hypothetical protein n=1 Tax=Microvirga makkahensis TaxID=1128670 RepID=UPI0014786813|nr:hypothetical protein [Microvirga makkahensis]
MRLRVGLGVFTGSVNGLPGAASIIGTIRQHEAGALIGNHLAGRGRIGALTRRNGDLARAAQTTGR